MPDLEDNGIFDDAYDDRDEGAEADYNNLETMEPKKVTHALDDESWVEAMQEELLQFKLLNVWTLMDLPHGKRATGTKWGHRKEEGIDYDEVFALVTRIEEISLFLAYASFMDFTFYQMDVKIAFLYGFVDPEFLDRVYKVEKALYGLHQAPRAWYETLSTYYLDNGFRRGTINKTLFIKQIKDEILLVQVYVDDIIFGSTKSNETAKDLWDALERQMRGSEYGEQDRKAVILYEYETFKAIEGEQFLDTYLGYLQVINDLKKCGYKKDNCELNYKFLNNLQPEWKKYGTLIRKTKNLMDINIDALYNILKQNQGDVNDASGYKKKAVMVTSDPLALVAEKRNVRRPKQSSVIWKQKWPSITFNVDLSSVSHLKLNKDVKRYSRKDLLSCNNSHLGETSSVYVCNDAMIVSCNSRLCDLFDENNLFIFDDESVRISPVSKMPFRKNPCDSMNIIDSGCSKQMTGNRALLTNFVEKLLGTVRFGNNDFAMIARTPQQNGVVERRNRTLVEAARTMLTFANLPLFLWAEAIATACFTLNRLIIHKHFDKTPYELMNKRKPNIKFFRVFGCRCYLLNDYEDVGKLKGKGDIGVFVRYSKESAAFRI
nr:hypothetical protein [Tanacetum cinerariifolium]